MKRTWLAIIQQNFRISDHKTLCTDYLWYRSDLHTCRRNQRDIHNVMVTFPNLHIDCRLLHLYRKRNPLFRILFKDSCSMPRTCTFISHADTDHALPQVCNIRNKPLQQTCAGV